MSITKKQHDELVKWIEENFYPSDRINHRFASNDIKTLWEVEHNRDSDLYIVQEDIERVMAECGFSVYDKKSPYWEFNVSLESPAYRRFLEYTGHRPR